MSITDRFTLRPGGMEDAATISALHRGVLGDSAGWSEDGLRRVMAAEAARVWIALPIPGPETRSAGAMVGFVVAFIAADEAEVLALCIAEEYRRKGLARALLRDLCRQLAAEGAVRLHLEVRASNFGARELYACNGFLETGRRKGYYRAEDGSPAEDAITMARVLTPAS